MATTDDQCRIKRDFLIHAYLRCKKIHRKQSMMSLSAVWQTNRDSRTGEVEAECHLPAAVYIHETTGLTNWIRENVPGRKSFGAEILHKYIPWAHVLSTASWWSPVSTIIEVYRVFANTEAKDTCTSRSPSC